MSISPLVNDNHAYHIGPAGKGKPDPIRGRYSVSGWGNAVHVASSLYAHHTQSRALCPAWALSSVTGASCFKVFPTSIFFVSHLRSFVGILYLILNMPQCWRRKDTAMPEKVGSSIPTVDDLHAEALALWPAAKGSLTWVRKPCTHPGCAKCASGEKHPVLLLVRRDRGRTRTVYVPPEMESRLRQAIENGRRFEALMADCGEALVKAHQATKRGR